jgi:hypothetical protein
VAQLNLYVPDDIARKLRLAAKKAKKSLSAYVLERVVEGKAAPRGWPKEFLELEGSWEGRFHEPEDPPPSEIAPL